jgi:GIY-YIG catalytic domain
VAGGGTSVFNAYQRTHGENLERVMTRAKYVASFIGHEPGIALFVGLFEVGSSKALTVEEYWKVPAYVELAKHGMKGCLTGDTHSSCLWFDLSLVDFYSQWKGKLTVDWPPPERSWWRRAHRNVMPVRVVLEESALDAPTKEWNEIVLTWAQLQALPKRLQNQLSQWRGIYYIFDVADNKGYVGSACGQSNILGRWHDYAASGHGGNQRLKLRSPETFRFTILQRVSPDMDPAEVVQLESNWKKRLHTERAQGLNDN